MRNISVVKIIFLVVLSCLLLTLSSLLSYAQDVPALKEENTRLQAEVNKIGLDRDELREKLKITTEENERFRDEISYLENEVADLDNARKTAEETNRAFSRRMADLHSELQSIKEAEDKLDKYKYTEKPGSPHKSVQELKETIGALEVERAVYIEKKRALDKQLKEASSDLYLNSEELKRLRAECALMHYNLGVIFQKANKWREAIKEYEKVLEILPNDADTHFNLALIYETTKNDRKKALSHYQKYLETNPSASDAASVKERIMNINAENRVWGEPHLGGVKESTERLW